MTSTSDISAAPASPAFAHYDGKIKQDDWWVDFASDEDNTDHFNYWNHFTYYKMFGFEQATDLAVSPQDRWNWNDGTDIVWFAYPVPDPAAADMSCRSVKLNGRCDRYRVRYKESLTRNMPDNSAWFIGCHEVGHTLGLEHLNDGCMHGAINTNYPPNNGVISDHMIEHINQHH